MKILKRVKIHHIIISLFFVFFIGIPTIALAAVYADGTVDTTFSVGTGASGIISAMVVQPDGKILINNLGTYNGVTTNGIARINTDGSLDTTFNTNIGTGANNVIDAIALQSTGKIIIVGHFTTFNGTTSSYAARLNSDGTPDNSFNVGSTFTNYNDGIGIQVDDKIVVSGNGTLVRLNADGSLDGTFTVGTANSLIGPVAIQSDGKIVIAGQFTTYNGSSTARIVRLNTDGSIDTSFNMGTGIGNNFVYSLIAQADGKIMVGGSFTTYQGVATNRIMRLNSDGSKDGTFVIGTGANNTVYTMTQQADGKTIIGGNFGLYAGTARTRLARINTDGSIDTTFNAGSVINLVQSSAALSDGRLMIGGQFSSVNGTAINHVARLTSIEPAPSTPDLIAASDSGYLNTDNITNVTLPTFTIGCITGDTVTLYDSATIIGTGLCAGGTVTITSSSTLSSGAHTIKANQTNPNPIIMTSAYSSTLSVTIDTTSPASPTVNINTLAPYSIDNPQVTFSATDNIGIEHYTLEYIQDNGAAGVSVASTTISTTSPAVLALDPDQVTSAPFAHAIVVVAYDAAGNTSTSTVVFPPLVSFNAPTTIKNTTISNATVTVTSPAGNPLTNIVLNAGTTGATLGTCTDGLGGTTDPYSNPVTCAIDNITTSGTIIVTANDNVTGATGQNQQTFHIETVAPVITITAPLTLASSSITSTTFIVTDDYQISTSGISIQAINTTGSFSVSGLSCTQTSATQVDCTVVIDGNHGTGDLKVTALDVAGNQTTATKFYTIDTLAPAVAQPSMATSSDTGSSNTDAKTKNTSPSFNVLCAESNAVINLAVNGSIVETHNCSATTTESIALTVPLTDGTYSVTYTSTDYMGNVSASSTVLSVIIDNTIIASSINFPTNGSPISGTAEPNSTVVATTTSGSICTTTSNSSGNWSCNLSPTPVNGEDVKIVTTDVFGNVDILTQLAVIDTIDPINLTLDPVNIGDKSITGTGESSSTITITGITCTNSPVIVTAGLWICNSPQPVPYGGLTVIAKSQDLAGNSTTTSYYIKPVSSGGGGTYGWPKPKTPVVTDTPAGSAGTSSCSPYLKEYIRLGRNNNPEEVKKLQIFLNTYEGQSLPVDGTYDLADENAVKAFQLKNKEYVLTPWNIDEPTGYVYISTIKAINRIYCEQKNKITCPFFTKIIPNKKTAPAQEVLKIRNFLVSLENEKISTSSVLYDDELSSAVKRFQDKYASDILTPWGLTEGTSLWYQSTYKKGNDILGCFYPQKLDNGKILP